MTGLAQKLAEHDRLYYLIMTAGILFLVSGALIKMADPVLGIGIFLAGLMCPGIAVARELSKEQAETTT
jgi:hypothetical protein